MDENVLFVIIAVDKTVAAFNVEPFDGTRNFGSYEKSEQNKN